MITNSIHRSFLETKKPANGHQNYPTKPGIYAFFLTSYADLDDFGQSGQLVYVGIAKVSLQKRDFDQHFRNGQTGCSTLRRSLGAILKNRLRLTAIPRGGAIDSKRFAHYRFTDIGEQDLTKWMKDNLEIGYWVSDRRLTNSQLRDEEKRTVIELRPTLDLDPRTRKYNPLADKLNELRKICRAEAEINDNL